MIKSLKVSSPSGEFLVIELKSPEKSGFFVRSIDGLGPVKSIINISESLYSNGGTFNSSRLSQRNVVLNIGFYDDIALSIEEIRNKLYRFFPTNTDLALQVETDSKIGILYGRVESNTPNIFSRDEGTQISFICPDPFYYATESVKTVFSGATPSFEFPFENPSLVSPLIEFGSVFINTSASVLYEGDSTTGVIIDIKFLGSVNNLNIHNVSTGENMSISSTKLIALTGSNFVIGDRVLISTIRGFKSITLIRSGVYTNILNTIDINSDWFQLKRGDNVFTYSAASGVSNLQFYIEHQPIYEGI